MKFLSFFNAQNIITILACVGVFFLATKIEKYQNKKELNRLDKVISNYQEKVKKDSASLAEYNSLIFSLQQTIDASKGNDQKFQLIISEKEKEIKALKNAENTCCEELKHLEETENIQYYTKDCLSKWYKRVLEKPKNIK
jgi:chromosome segregation ATPase